MSLLLCGVGCGDTIPPVNPSYTPPQDAHVALPDDVSPDLGPGDVLPPAEESGLADAPTSDGRPTPPSIVGTWRDTDVGACVSEHRFTEEGGYFISATSGERVVGRFRWSPGAPGERSELVVALDSDNGGPDCNGIARNESGESHTAYVEFRGADRAVLYRSPRGDDEWFRLFR